MIDIILFLIPSFIFLLWLGFIPKKKVKVYYSHGLKENK